MEDEDKAIETMGRHVLALMGEGAAVAAEHHGPSEVKMICMMAATSVVLSLAKGFAEGDDETEAASLRAVVASISERAKMVEEGRG